jgi:hypothetical protein
MGLSRAPIGEEAGFDPINLHGASEAKAEKLFHQLAAKDPGARMLIIRPSVVYEPGNPPSTNIYRLLGKTPPLWHIPLSIATPIAKVSDVAAECTGIEFTGVKLPSVSRLRLVSFHSFTFVNSLRSFTDVNSLYSFPITAARIRDVQPLDELRRKQTSGVRIQAASIQ